MNTTKFFRNLFKRLASMLGMIVTGKLNSYEAAKDELLPGVERRQYQHLSAASVRTVLGPAASSLLRETHCVIALQERTDPHVHEHEDYEVHKRGH
jgi:hypothetical protein